MRADCGQCRIAFKGRVIRALPGNERGNDLLRLYKLKRKEGRVDRIEPGQQSIICAGLFQKNADLSIFSGMKLCVYDDRLQEDVHQCPVSSTAVIEGSFGTSGKVRAKLLAGAPQVEKGQRVVLEYKKFV